MKLSRGSHYKREDGMCALEAVAMLAGEKHSALPSCISDTLIGFVGCMNDDNADFREKIIDLLPKLIGTKNKNLEHAKACRETFYSPKMEYHTNGASIGFLAALQISDANVAIDFLKRIL